MTFADIFFGLLFLAGVGLILWGFQKERLKRGWERSGLVRGVALFIATYLGLALQVWWLWVPALGSFLFRLARFKYWRWRFKKRPLSGAPFDPNEVPPWADDTPPIPWEDLKIDTPPTPTPATAEPVEYGEFTMTRTVLPFLIGIFAIPLLAQKHAAWAVAVLVAAFATAWALRNPPHKEKVGEVPDGLDWLRTLVPLMVGCLGIPAIIYGQGWWAVVAIAAAFGLAHIMHYVPAPPKTDKEKAAAHKKAEAAETKQVIRDHTISRFIRTVLVVVICFLALLTALKGLWPLTIAILGLGYFLFVKQSANVEVNSIKKIEHLNKAGHHGHGDHAPH